MGRLNYPRDTRKVKEGEEYVALRELRVGSKIIKSGDRVDVKQFTRLRLRQLVEWRRVVPRWYFNQQMGIEVETKSESSSKKVKKKVARKKEIEHGVSA